MVRLWAALLAAGAAAAAADDFARHVAAATERFHQGEYAAAESILLAALKEADGFGPDDPRKAIVLNNLGSVYHFTNRYPQAEQCYRRAAEIERTAWAAGDDRPIRSILNLAALYIEAGQYAKAERLGLRSLAERQPASQRNRPDFARLLSLLADLAQARGSYAEAQRHGEEALAILEAVAPDGVETIEILNNLCFLYGETGRYTEALARCERALRIAEGTFNLEPSLQVSLLANAGAYQFLVHGPAEAERFYAKALAIAGDTSGRQNPILGRVLLSYAAMLDRTGRNVQAKECRRRGKAMLEAASATDRGRYTVDLDDLFRKSRNR